MNEFLFDMENIKFGQKRNQMVLLQDGEILYLGVKDCTNQEIMKIKVLHISKVKKLTNFFLRGFNISLEGKTEEELLIPEENLREAERKIIVSGKDSEERIKNAIYWLEKKFEGKVERANYLRTMRYLDTPNRDLLTNYTIFRLTQENKDVKATMHMRNNLPGDLKLINKFFFTETAMPQVINFFRETLSLEPITKAICSTRKEWDTLFGEVAVDKMKDKNVDYYVMELELDKFKSPDGDSTKVDKAARKIATEIGLGDCEIVDLGTEAIYDKESGQDFFEVNKMHNRQKE